MIVWTPEELRIATLAWIARNCVVFQHSVRGEGMVVFPTQLRSEEQLRRINDPRYKSLFDYGWIRTENDPRRYVDVYCYNVGRDMMDRKIRCHAWPKPTTDKEVAEWRELRKRIEVERVEAERLEAEQKALSKPLIEF